MTDSSKLQDKYDVIIIGAGIGGLVCGCYLAKAGMKVLIVEKHSRVGGYCSSFKRNGFTFDTGIHYIGNLREGAMFSEILKELGLEKELIFKRCEPSDIVITPDYKITVYNDSYRSIEAFQKQFPHEKDNLRVFFDFIMYSNFVDLYSELKNKTFSYLLDKYFSDSKLKSIITILTVSLGLPATMVSALATSVFLKEFILDGGYYPIGGMQAFSDLLAHKFKEYGGELLLRCLVDRVVVRNHIVEGITIKDNFIKSRYVVANCDALQLFSKMIEEQYVPREFIVEIENMVPSVSTFMVFLGIDRSLRNVLDDCCALWYFQDYKIDEICSNVFMGHKESINKFVLCSFPSLHDSKLAPKDSETVCLVTAAPYLNRAYWEKNKIRLADALIKIAAKILPELNGHIIVKEIATPYTLYKYTLNHNGAFRGWALINSQTNSYSMPNRTLIKRLFLAGHWTTSYAGQGGVAMVAYSGRRAAKSILKEERQK